MLYGHRQDAKGMAAALAEFDKELPSILNVLHDGDLLILTADHGNDPADKSTDHSREYVPLLCFAKAGKRNVNLGIRSTFADVAQTVSEFFSLGREDALAGNSFLSSVV
jgi:phosphopentomutase